MAGSSVKRAVGIAAAIVAAGLWTPASAAPVGDQEARDLVAEMFRGRLADQGGWSVQYAPVRQSIALGQSRRVLLQNLSYGFKEYRVKMGDVAVLVGPAEPASAAADAPSQPADAGLGSVYPVSFHLPDSISMLEKGKPLGSVAIGYSSVEGRWAPRIKAFLSTQSETRALALSGVKGVTATVASVHVQQNGHGTGEQWSAEGVASVRGVNVQAQDMVFGLEEATETSSIQGFPLLPWFDIVNRVLTLIPQHPERLTEAQQNSTAASIFDLFAKAPTFADHLGVEMKLSGISAAQGATRSTLGQFGFTMGYDATAKAGDTGAAATGGPAPGDGEPVSLGTYRFGFTMAGLGVPQQPIRDVLGPAQGDFVGHAIPTDISLKVEAANVPTRALLDLAERASAGMLARDSKAPVADTPDDTPAKVAGEAWQLLKRVKTSLRTGLDIASDMVKINSLSNYVADASQPTGQVNTTKITVAGLDALLASYKAPDRSPPAKPVPGGKGKPQVVGEDTDSMLNFALLGVRFVKGIGTPRVDGGAIVYDYLIETDQNGRTLINGQDFVAMTESFEKGMPDKM